MESLQINNDNVCIFDMKRTWKESFAGERVLSLTLVALLLGMAGCKKTEVTLKAEEAAVQEVEWDLVNNYPVEPGVSLTKYV